MTLEIVPSYDRAEDVAALFTEYTDYLVAEDVKFAEYLNMQNYDQELSHLRQKYGPPRGRLYLAYVDGLPAGCIALRPIDENECEMKRLYVRPAYRSAGLGRRLVELILSDARDLGYRRVLMDTLPFLKDAIALYEKLGFYRIGCYNNSPMDESIYMQYDLKEAAADDAEHP